MAARKFTPPQQRIVDALRAGRTLHRSNYRERNRAWLKRDDDEYDVAQVNVGTVDALFAAGIIRMATGVREIDPNDASQHFTFVLAPEYAHV
jgi:hypothetical protein